MVLNYILVGCPCLFCFNMSRCYQIWIVECLYSFGDDLPESLGKTTAQECKKSTYGWRASLKWSKGDCLSAQGSVFDHVATRDPIWIRFFGQTFSRVLLNGHRINTMTNEQKWCFNWTIVISWMKGNLGERGRSKCARNTVLAGSAAVSPTSHVSHTDSFVEFMRYLSPKQ